MRYKTVFSTFIFISIFLVASLGGCTAAGPVQVPPPPPPPPASEATFSTSPAAIPTLATTPVLTSTAAISAVPSQTITTSATPVIIYNKATSVFADKIDFSLSITNPPGIKAITLLYGSDQRTLAPENKSSKPNFTEGKTVSVSWAWEMKKIGVVPPGASIWWQWEVTDGEGKVITIPKKSIIYDDTRYQWKNQEYPDYNIYWHDQAAPLINELLDEVKTRLSKIKLEVSIPAVRKPKVLIYRSSDELKDAILFSKDWTGAMAFPSYNIILTAVSSSSLDWAKDTLPHEITHLLVGEATFGPFDDIPQWLSEGLAEQVQVQMPNYNVEYLNNAITGGTLISIRSLSSNFPSESSGAYLAYAESSSIVKYLIDTYGWDKMRQLLATFKEGSSYDKALLKVYSFDIAGLEARWKTCIGAK